ncbi:MAG: DUF11 domain-containing protein [Alphaproteobacteria bacterium]|nr:DUF11 domain-containing protein [Alphaproteobacteria bacterium]
MISAAKADITNSATASGTYQAQSYQSNTATAAVPVSPAAPLIGLVKAAGTITDTNNNGVTDAGDTLSYAFTVSNLGNVTLNAITVSDPKLGSITCPQASLAAGASMSCTAPAYVLTQADLDAGHVSNQAKASGTSPGGTTVSDFSDPVTAGPATDAATDTPLAQKPLIGLVKTAGAVVDANSNGITDAGDTISYSLVVSNLGNVTLNSIAVTDAKLGTVTCPVSSLSPGATANCTAAAYVLTQADLNAGHVSNQAKVTATSPAGTNVSDFSDPAIAGTTADGVTDVTLAGKPGIGLVKTSTLNDVNNDGVADLGDTITYAFKVSNLGNVTLASVAVTDSKVSGINCPQPSLDPGKSETCTAVAYPLTQVDIDNGQVTNTATASGTPPTGPAVTDVSDPATAGPAANAPTVTTLAPAPAIGIVKPAGTFHDLNSNGQPDAGETMSFTFHVTNMGNVTLANVTVADPKVTNITCALTSLNPGQGTDCAGDDYVITQADINADKVSNQATASGVSPKGVSVVDASDPATPGTSANAVTTTPLAQKPGVGLVKVAGAVIDANNDGLIDVGDKIHYTFAVTNMGNTTLNNVTVTDSKITGVNCISTTLQPGQVTSCTGTFYIITQADVDAGQVTNTASVSANPPTGPPVTDISDPATPGPGHDASTVTSLSPTPQIGLVKKAGVVADANHDSLLDAGDTITYTFTVTNLGNLTLHGVTVADNKVSPVTCPATPLPPQQSFDCTAPAYVITAADLNAGKVVNSASATGLSPSNQAVSDISDDTTPGPAANNPTVTSLAPAPAIGLVKQAGPIVDANTDGKVDAGDTVAYSFTVTNMGNVTLDNIAVTDPKLANITCSATTLDAGASTLCSAPAPYVLTQTDVDAGRLSNQAKVTALPPVGAAVSDLSDETVPGTGANADNPTVVNIPQSAVIGLVKVAGPVVDVNNNGQIDAGDTITYAFTVSNLGTVTLTNVSVSDPKLASVTCASTTLVPGASANCTAPAYVITQADITAGKVSNQAKASGQPPFGLAVTDNSDPTTAGPAANAPTVVTVQANPVIGLVKAASPITDVNSNGMTDAGDTVTYSFTVSNLGNQPLDPVTVSDAKLGTVSCPAGALQPGASVACTAAPYAITQADMDAGSLSNTATATGTAPGGIKVTDDSDPVTAGPSANAPTVTTLTVKPSLSLAKADTLVGPMVAGSTINYKFTVKNTGNVTITNVTLADTGATVSGGPIASLAPGATDSTTFTGSHVVTAADIAAHSYTNTATVTGQPANPGAQPVSAPASVTTPLNYTASMTFTKSGTLAKGNAVPPRAGDTVNYTFTVTNTGNSPLHNVTISDPLVAEAATVQTHAVAMLQAAKGKPDELMTAGIESLGPRSGIVAAAQRAHAAAPLPEVKADLNVARSLVRMSGGQGPLQPGEKIGFLFRLANTGEVPLTSITIAQPDSLAFGSEVSLLNPNATDDASIIFTREVTPDEIASGVARSNAYVLMHAQGREVLQVLAEALPLSSVKAYDSFATASITPATLAQLDPGKSFTFTAPYILSQAEIDSGNLHNDATANALDVANQSLPPLSTSFDLPLPDPPAIGVVKTGAVTFTNGTSAQVGDVVTYHFAVTNLGNVTLHNVGVTDTSLAIVGGTIASLAPGVTDTSLTGTYALTQADIDAGHHDNQATASGTSPSSVTVSAASDFADPAQHRITVLPLTPKPAIGIKKSVTSVVDKNNNGRNDAGDEIHYLFEVQNTGNVTLTNVVVTDPLMPGAPAKPLDVVTGGPITLAPGASDSKTFTGVYVIEQKDMDLGHVDNTATVTGTAPDNSKVSDQSDPDVKTQDFSPAAPTVQALTQLPQITLYKKRTGWDDKNKDGIIDAGDVLHYTFTVQNPGNVTLTNLQVIDDLAAATVSNGNPGLVLAPGTFDGSTFTATYTVTTADEKAGVVKNSAKVTATQANTSTTVQAASVNGDPASFTAGTTDTPIQPTPTIAVILGAPNYADTNNDGVVNAGDTLTYPISIKNTGAVTLNNIKVTDSNAAVTITCPASLNLNPGQEDTLSCTASYVLTAADVAAGKFDTQVLATGISSPGNLNIQDLSDPADYAKDAPTHFVIGATPRIAVQKKFSHFETVAGVTVAVPSPGDVAVYAVLVKNTGNVDFTDVALAEAVGFAGTIVGSYPLALAAGAEDTTHFSVRQTIANADILAGSISNQLSATGVNAAKGNSPPDLSDPASYAGDGITTVALVAKPGIAVIKTFTVEDVNGNGANDTGDVIHYSFQVANTGNVDLTNVSLADAGASLTPLNIPLLKAGAVDTVTFKDLGTPASPFKATHVITAAELATGHYDNQATATGTYNVGQTVSGDSDYQNFSGPRRATVTQLSAAKPVLTKTAARSQVKRGEVVPYTITATNLGAGPFQIADIMPPGFGFVAGSAVVNGGAVVPVVNGQTLTFNALTPVAGKITLTLNLMASTTLSGGKFINNARLIDPATGLVIAVAQATVEVIPEAVFDCSDIIGRVFDDLNGNGYMDDGEPGLAGVRLATLNGVLITTDSEGRYHVPCAAIPDAAIGSNYLLKLDPRTLPTGYKLTTENPRDVRVTRGKATVLNFGAAIQHDVKVDVTAKAFVTDGPDLSATWQAGIGRLCKILTKKKSALQIIYHQGGESGELAQARADTLEAEINAACDPGYPLVIKTKVEEGK